VCGIKFFPGFLPMFAEKVSIRYYPFADGRQFRNDVRYRFFYNAAVFLYSGVERNDTTNFREKKIFVSLFPVFEEVYQSYIIYPFIHILYIHILFIYIIFLFFFPNVLWYQFFVTDFRQLLVFGIKRSLCRMCQE
jgi:hypothetical protein